MSNQNSTRRLAYFTATAAAALLCTAATGASAQFIDYPLAGALQGQYSADVVKAVTAEAADSTKAIAAKQKLVDDATTAANAILTTAAKTTAANAYVAKSAADAAAQTLVDTTSTALTNANSAVADANALSAPLATAATGAATALTTAKATTATALATYRDATNSENLAAYNSAVAAQTFTQSAYDTAAALAAPKLAATAAAVATAVSASVAAASAATAQGLTAAALNTAVDGLDTAGISAYSELLNNQVQAQLELADATDQKAYTLAYAAKVNGGATILTGVAATANTASNAKAAARALLDTSIAGDSTAEVEMVRGLNNEELQRTAADVVLGGRITTETTRATTAETGLGNRITILTEQVKKDIAAATAVSVALGGNSFLPGKKFNLTVNVGSYDGESALAAQFGFMVNDSLAINGGVASGFGSGSSTAVRGGFTYGW